MMTTKKQYRGHVISQGGSVKMSRDMVLYQYDAGIEIVREPD